MSENYVINGRFLSKKITGVERYAIEILNELDKIVKPGQVVLVAPMDSKLPYYTNITVKKIGYFRDILWEQISFPIYAIRKQLIPLSFCNVAPLLYPGVVFLHDVKVKAKPEYFSWKFRLWYKILLFNTAKRAKKIYTVSDFSKNEIVKYLHISPIHIAIIPSAWSHFERISEDYTALEKYNLTKAEYYFSMSSLEPNKNFKWTAEIARRYPNYLFVIAGSINKKVFSDGFEFECPSNMKFLGYVSDEEAKALMHYCKAFVFPTIYEGFGLPPLEAIGSGCTSIVISDTDVMHEIYGECGTYIDPMKYEFDDRILKNINQNQRIELLNRYKWSNNAKRLVLLLNEENSNYK